MLNHNQKTDFIHGISNEFWRLAKNIGRKGVIGFVPIDGVKLIPQQRAYLKDKIKKLDKWKNVSAVVIGLCYHEAEILSIPDKWIDNPLDKTSWNKYARAYTKLNRQLNDISGILAAKFGGISEQSTVEGVTGTVNHVDDYFKNCVSHGAFAEAAGLGWKGRHGLIVTPEAGPALRFGTIFVRGIYRSQKKSLPGCENCFACLKICANLKKKDTYRELCRKRLFALALDDEVCGLCVRACWEAIKGKFNL